MNYKLYKELFRSQDYQDLKDKYRALSDQIYEVNSESFQEMYEALRDVIEEREYKYDDEEI